MKYLLIKNVAETANTQFLWWSVSKEKGFLELPKEMLTSDIQTLPLLQAARAGAGFGVVLMRQMLDPCRAALEGLSSYAEKNKNPWLSKSHATDLVWSWYW